MMHNGRHFFFLEREGVRCQVDLRWLLTSQCGTGDLHIEMAAVPPCHDNIERVLCTLYRNQT